MITREVLARGGRMLEEAGIEGGPRDARRLMAHALEVTPTRLTLELTRPITTFEEDRFMALIERRIAREPVSHLVGGREFWGRWFKVTPDVLDPRPETESLIAAALEAPFGEVLDLGTGSGCILLTLLAERRDARGLGVDASPPALAVARENARALGLSPRARLEPSDWVSAVSGRFDLVVSNPPYIAASEMQGLAPELRREPRMALTDERDGLTAYREIARGAPGVMTTGGRLMVEIGPTQGRAVAGLFAAAGLQDVRVLPDLDGRDRVVAARAG